MATQYVPLRSCLTCGRRTRKMDLIRVVKTPEGIVEIDSAGIKDGRGAYFCPHWKCAMDGIGKPRFERAIKCVISEETRRRLLLDCSELVGPYLGGKRS